MGRCIWLLGVGLVLAMGTQQSLALTKEQAIENCRMSVGRPFVQQCMHGGNGDREGCREKARPHVRACVIKALNAANGRANVPVAMPVEKGPSEEIAKQAKALPARFVPPPRAITDITGILDSEKPDPAKIAQLKADADAAVPSKASRVDLARFYYKRGTARAALGRVKDALDDADKALQNGRGALDANTLGRIEQFAGLQISAAGDPKQALAIFQRQIRDTNAPGAKGYLFNATLNIVAILIQLGDLAQAEGYLNRSIALLREARTSGLPGWRNGYAGRGQSWEADVEQTRAVLFEARGQYAEAEQSYRRAELRKRASIDGVMKTATNPPPRWQIEQACDILVIDEARTEARQGKLAQAEADARRALLSQLKGRGKYNTATPRFLGSLANILVEEGRYSEAERLARTAIQINDTLGVAADAQSTLTYESRLAAILSLEHKRAEAMAMYEKIASAMASWDAARREPFDLDGSRISALYAAGQVEKGVAAAERLLKRNLARYGEGRHDTAIAHGLLGTGLMLAQRDDEAGREFRAAIPVLLAAARETSDDSATLLAARNERLRNIVESYMTLLARSSDNGKAALETFALADAIRGRSVQQALTASSARMSVQDAALAELVRDEQDLSKRVNAQLGMLNNTLSLPSGQRDETTVKALEASIAKLRSERDRSRSEIGRRFPRYADLIDPKPPSVEQIKAVLKPDEAVLAFYFGRQIGFVWAVPKNGPVGFASIAASAGDLEKRIRKLREALEPQVATVAEIPPFDLALAYGLYEQLLKPVEAAWKPATHLIVVSNGALGLLPLSLLPTAPATADDGDRPLFSGYRKVPWLARTHAVSLVPSVAALRTLRQMPPGSRNREPMIGFGDPVFSKEQISAEQAARDTPVQLAMATRGVPLKRRSSPKLDGVDSAELAQLPPLPDTADELKAIAHALGADPATALVLGVKANEETVKATDLARYKIVVFATHGLAAGELNGLTQPALALTAPDVAGIDGDGLLTMEKIIALKLDADWVVLSACNTGAASGAGAEAASGLGQAFFYAGARALLVTNWSVDSQSARQITSGLFARQSANNGLSRAEALRQSMMALLDGGGYTDENGATLFVYAHPLFWAPYSIIGDGGL
ncbi:MAG TPA: CHAT domain-containing tetratricopeptide repeat protein [Pseudolabrys sp.]|nr:CHAT domain-containing tetratricopeptide repeat protein [Pseudolabrys sp.]